MSQYQSHSFNKHDCQLPQRVKDEFRPSPYTSVCQKLCFQFRTYFTVYKNTVSQQYFRSNASLNRERSRHLGTYQYRYVIHPFSKFAMLKKTIVCMLWFATLVLDPFMGSFLHEKYFSYEIHPALTAVYAVMQMLLIGDMISRFFVGYIITKTREIVLTPKRIVKHYLSGYFLIDFIPNIPTIVWLTVPHVSAKYGIILYQLRLIKALRLKTLINNLDLTLKRLNVDETVRICLRIFVVCILLVHWWTCITALIVYIYKYYGIVNDKSWIVKVKKHREQLSVGRPNVHFTVFDDYVHFVALIMCHFFGAGYNRYKIECSVEMTVLSMVIITGLMFHIYILAKLLDLFGVVNIAESKYEELVNQVTLYLASMKAPREIKKRINQYYEFTYNKTFFSEKKILESLSEHLRMEVLLYSCQNLVQNVQLFRGLSKSAVGCILSLLEQKIYLPGDLILLTTEDIGTLYFILHGTCAVQLPTGQEAIHVEDGDHFGEIKRVGVPRDIFYQVVALEPCEIYLLTSKNIAFCCRNYPEITLKFEVMANAKTKYYRGVLEMAESEEEIQAMDIIDELRRGRILHHGRKREVRKQMM